MVGGCGDVDTYIEELRVVLLAVNDWFTHFGFCVGHEDRDRVKIE